MEHNVLVLKLASGEELISKTKELENDCLELYMPHAYIIQQDPNTGKNLSGLMPFMLLAKNQSMILTQRPVIIAEPSDEAKDAYLRMIGDIVIKTPKKEIILAK